MFSKKIILLLTFAVITSIGQISCTSRDQKTTPPNIIVFLVDDMGLMDTSLPFLTGEDSTPKRHALNDFYKTPNMIELANKGIRFSNFYAHSVCSPSRTSLMTGQNSARHKVTTWIKPEENNKSKYGPENWNWNGLKKSSITLPHLLQEQGYKTIHVGKAHFGPNNSEGADPKNIGFEVNIAGGAIGHPGSYYAEEGYGHIKGNKLRAVPGLKKYHGTNTFLTEALTIEAIAEISKAKEENKPFFLNMAHYAVHAPFQPDPRFVDAYKDANVSNKVKAYASLIQGIDKSLGDIIQHVETLGLGENTLILFIGDNGSDAPFPINDNYSSSIPLKGKKGNHWEGGMRVPFIASWITPNSNNFNQQKTPIVKNGIQKQLGSILDIFPTICNIANINSPKQHVLDGFSLEQQLKGQKNDTRTEQFLNHFPHSHRSNYFTSYVNTDWKIIYHYPIDEKPRYELFNLKNDPFEVNNLADTDPKQLKIMMGKLAKEMSAKNALYPEKENKQLKLVIP